MFYLVNDLSLLIAFSSPNLHNEPLNCHNANWIPLTSAPERSTQTQGQMNDGRGRSGRNGRRER